jgi:hypothetical protein
MRNPNQIPNSKEGLMRLNLNRLVTLAAIVAVGLMAGCSADSPGPTGVKPPPGNNGLVITITANPANPVQGTCSFIVATATQNGTPVPAGTAINLSSTFGVFAQNGQQTISLETTNGSAQTAICSNLVGPATVTGTVTVGSNTASGSRLVNFQSNGIKTTFISVCANPHTGPVSGGTPITITGGGLGVDNTTVPVIFRSGAFVHQTNGTVGGGGTTITATTPAFPELAGLPATPVEIDVLIAGQTLSSPACFTYTSDSTPIVSAILPSSGSKVGGTRVTITGSGFSGQVQVFFGGTLEAQVVSVSPTQIIAITPPANGEGPSQAFPLTVDVTVKEVNCAGSGCTSGAVPFTYTVGLSIFGFTPDHGDSSTTVTITGQGFVAPLIVTFGGVQGTVVSVSGTQILAKPPSGCPGVPSGAITVTLLADGETASSSSSFRVTVPAISSGPIPSSGAGGTSTSVTLIGTGFFPSGQPSLVSVDAAGGSVNGITTSELNGQQTITLNVTPNKCSPQVTLTLVNGATGCAITASPITNSTFTEAGPTAVINTPVPGPTNNHVSFTAATSTSGTAGFTYAWAFTNPDGTSAGASNTQNPGSVAFNCGTDGPACPGPAQATLTVTDACGKTATTSTTATPQ